MDFYTSSLLNVFWSDIERRERKFGERIFHFRKEDLSMPVSYLYDQLKTQIKHTDLYIVLYYFEPTPLRIECYGLLHPEFIVEDRGLRNISIEEAASLTNPIITNPNYPLSVISYFISKEITSPYRSSWIAKDENVYKARIAAEEEKLREYKLQGYRAILTGLVEKEELVEDVKRIVEAVFGVFIISIADTVYINAKIREEFPKYLESFERAQDISLGDIEQTEWEKLYRLTEKPAHEQEFVKNLSFILAAISSDSPDSKNLNEKRSNAQKELDGVINDFASLLETNIEYKERSYPVIGLKALRDNNYIKEGSRTKSLLGNFSKSLSGYIENATHYKETANEVRTFINEMINIRNEIRSSRNVKALAGELKKAKFQIELEEGMTTDEKKEILKFPSLQLAEKLHTIREHGKRRYDSLLGCSECTMKHFRLS